MEKIKDSNSILQSLRESPFNSANRDVLLISEKWLKSGLHLPPFHLFKNVFKGITDYQWIQIIKLSYCSSNVIQLNITATSQKLSEIDHHYIHEGILLYTLEAQRILSSIFKYEHPIWKTYYNKVSLLLNLSQETNSSFISKNSFYILPLDAIHELTLRKLSLEYELITQSFRSILSAYDPEIKDQERTYEYLNLALRIIRNIPVDGYDLWVRNLFILK